MPCIALPAPVIPTLPAGISLPSFTPPVLPNIGLCCNLPIPSYPVPNIPLPIAFPFGVITTLNGYLKAVQAFFDALQVSCPLQ